MDRWIGKVAIVTGASSGIGAAIAKKLVEQGIAVVGCARRVELVEKLAEELKTAPGKLYPRKCDITLESDIIDTFAWTKDEVGHISIMINNAGMMKRADLVTLSHEHLTQSFQTNVIGLTTCTKEAIKDMIDNNINGHIININSVCGYTVSNSDVSNVYPATKHAVKIITESFRLDLARMNKDIKVTSISPGLVGSDFHNEFPPDIKQWIDGMAKLSPEDVATNVMYALSLPPHVNITEMLIRSIGETF